MSTDNVYVYPTQDLIEHVTDGDGCPCIPTTEAVEHDDGSYGWVILHHSLDGREFAEPDYTGAPMPIEP